MFGKIDMVAEPDDRLLVIVGSGHATWLKHFASHMPGYRVVDPTPYLIGAQGRRRSSKLKSRIRSAMESFATGPLLASATFGG